MDSFDSVSKESYSEIYDESEVSGEPIENFPQHIVGLKKILRSSLGGENALKVEEFKEAFEMIGFKNDEFKTLICPVNNKGKSCIDLTKFVELILNDLKLEMNEGEKDEDLQKETDKCVAAFLVFDPYDTGFISLLELRTILLELGDQLTEEEWNDFVKITDIERDGQINYEVATETFYKYFNRSV
ncbi:neo-calmodulin isoform X1 [Hydra vulgaris]|uniref:neo-calmodulin isoform X1 n=1 Tax=Hydra vulgaris TaxID=6087 RepID=UPI00064100D5|nr:neo-calmodulin [Hydra vulgaris]